MGLEQRGKEALIETYVGSGGRIDISLRAMNEGARKSFILAYRTRIGAASTPA